MNARRFQKFFSSVISLLLMSSGFLVSIFFFRGKSAAKKRRARRLFLIFIRALRFFAAQQLSYNRREVENAFRPTDQISIRRHMEEWIRQPVSRLKARFLDGHEPAPRGLLEALEAD